MVSVDKQIKTPLKIKAVGVLIVPGTVYGVLPKQLPSKIKAFGFPRSNSSTRPIILTKLLLRTMEDPTAGVVIDTAKEKPPLTATAAELKLLLECIRDKIFPVTQKGVEAGNKVFGAAVLNPSFETVIADTNTETTCPLFHGEVKLIYEWSKIVPAKDRGPAAQSAVFLATHEPCCMCISSIVWSGFTKVFYFFPYTSTAAQGVRAVCMIVSNCQ